MLPFASKCFLLENGPKMSFADVIRCVIKLRTSNKAQEFEFLIWKQLKSGLTSTHLIRLFSSGFLLSTIDIHYSPECFDWSRHRL